MRKFLYIFSLLIAVIASQVAIFYLFNYNISEIKKINLYLAERYKVIFFGDSAIGYHDNSDLDKSSIVQMLEKNIDVKIGDLSHGAYHPGIYEAFIDFIIKSKDVPQIIVIPINLRSFSPTWDLRPGYQFEKERFFLTADLDFYKYFFKPLAALKVINLDEVTYEKFLSHPVYYWDRQVGTVKDFEAESKFNNVTEENIKSKFIYDYMYKLAANHRKIRSLLNIVDLAKKRNIKIIFYLMPIDYQTGEKYLGQDFYDKMKINSDLVCDLLKKKGSICENYTFSLAAGNFGYSAYPNEHLKEAGRRFIADKLSSLIESNNYLK